MDKLTLFKSTRQRFRDHITLSRHYRQAQYKDSFIEQQKVGGTKIPFGYSNAMLGHMMELRMWHIAYAPTQTNKLTKMQELHRLDGELNYRIARAIYYRVVAGFFILLFIRKIGKNKYLNNGEKDSHEIDLRDTTATD